MVVHLLKKYHALPLPIKASFWFLVCSFLQKGISIITTPIFTRLLDPAEYGMFSVFISWLNIVTTIVTLNLFDGVYLQGLVKFDNKRSQYSSAMQGLCLTLCIGWFVIYLIFRDFWNKIFSLSTIQMTSMIIMIWTSSVFNFWAKAQRVDYKYLKLVVITISVAIAKPALGVYLVLHTDDKVTARILGLVAVELIFFTWLFFVQIMQGKSFFSWPVWRYAIMFNVPLLPHYLSNSILNTADRIMIEKMVGANEAGIYSLAYSVALIMTLFNTAMLQTIEPWLYKKIKLKDLTNISSVAYPSLIVIAGVNIVLIVCVPEVVFIFAPAKYYDAIWIIPPVAMSSYFMFIYYFFAVFEFYYEKIHFIVIATMFCAALKFVLNYVFIGIFGYYAAGYTTLLCFIIYAGMHYTFVNRICHNYMGRTQVCDMKILWAITVIFMVLGFTIMSSYKIPVIRYLFIVLLTFITLIKRKGIFRMFQKLLTLRKNKEESK